jgi:hypothetical protein
MDEDIGKEELNTLSMMFERWLKSDFDWAVKILVEEGSSGEEDEWDFLRREWIDKLENWIGPFVRRLEVTEYITEGDVRDFGLKAVELIDLMLEALYILGGNKSDE